MTSKTPCFGAFNLTIKGKAGVEVWPAMPDAARTKHLDVHPSD
jgi:hypothetical protein